MKFFFVLILYLFSSCSFQQIKYLGEQSFTFQKLEDKKVFFNAGAKISNPNNFAIKLRPSSLSLYIEGEYIGIINLNEEVRLKRKSKEYVEGSFTASTRSFSMNEIFRISKFITKKEIEICLKGDLQSAVWIFGKKVHVNEKIVISGLDLKKFLTF